MLYKSKFIFTLLFILFFIQNILFANGVKNSAENSVKNSIEKKNILLIHSYHPGMTWVENINKAVDDVFNSTSNNFVIYTEYMDTKRHNSKSYYAYLKQMYKEKYKNSNFDIILSSDNNAFDFLVKNKKEIFGDVSVSFCGVNNFKKSMLKNTTNFTGSAEKFSAKETVQTILKLHPNTKKIFIINDYLATGKAWTKDMKKSLHIYEDKIDIEYSKNLTLKALQNKIASLEENTVILLGVYFADKNKNYITYEKIGSYLLKESKVPTYCLLNFNISNDVIGGKVIGGYSQGKAMSKIALRILNQEKPSNIPVQFSGSNEYIFNFKGLEKHNIEINLLPKNSKIINKPYSLYEEYKTILFNLLILFVAITIILLLSTVYLKNTKKINTTNKDNLIISIIRFTPIITIPITTILIIWLFINTTNQKHQQLQKIEKESYIQNMKQISKREVDRFIQIAQARLSNKNNMNLQQIKEHLAFIAKHIRYGKSGYLLINTANGDMVAHPNKELVGVNIFDKKHEKAKNVFIKFKNKIKNQGSGFVQYAWINPNSKVQEEKLTYVSYIPQLNWYVASGVYLDEADRLIESKIKNDALFEEKNINIILISSFALLIVSLIISITLSIIIKKVFQNYHNNILKEVKKSEVITKAKEEFETIFKYAQDGIVITNLDGDFIKFNNAFIELTGFSKEELKTKSYDQLLEKKETKKDIQNAIASEHLDNFEENFIIKNNKTLTVHISISLLPKKQSLLMIIKDATSIKTLQEQSKNAALGEMIGNIAHQWRQPLSVISTGATGLKISKEYDTLTDENFIHTCDTINDNAQYLSKTIDDFKNFIKGDRKAVQFNLYDNIVGFLHLVEGAAKNNEIEVIKNIDHSINLFGYPNELKQCFINLFNNAKDALANNPNENKYFFIDAIEQSNEIVITFKDNGGGIPNEIVDHIFEPYFTTKHKSKGTGLGLSMTYNLIVNGMKGKIEASNVSYTHNKKNYTGAQFTITLPLS